MSSDRNEIPREIFRLDWPAIWREADRRLPEPLQMRPGHMLVLMDVIEERISTSKRKESETDV